MVLYVAKWNIRPDNADRYAEWAKSAMNKLFSVPGVIEFRAYRPATGSFQVIVTYEFADMQDWAQWNSNEDIQRLWDESRLYVDNVCTELWGPSPIITEPIHPNQ